MSLAATPSRILRRQLPRNGAAAVQQLSARRCYVADAKKEEKESFKGQLYQSTAERLKREGGAGEVRGTQRGAKGEEQSSVAGAVWYVGTFE